MTMMPRAINAAAKVKIKNFVGKQSASSSPAPKAAKVIPAHLPFEHISNTSLMLLLHYMPKEQKVIMIITARISNP